MVINPIKPLKTPGPDCVYPILLQKGFNMVAEKGAWPFGLTDLDWSGNNRLAIVMGRTSPSNTGRLLIIISQNLCKSKRIIIPSFITGLREQETSCSRRTTRKKNRRPTVILINLHLSKNALYILAKTLAEMQKAITY